MSRIIALYIFLFCIVEANSQLLPTMMQNDYMSDYVDASIGLKTEDRGLLLQEGDGGKYWSFLAKTKVRKQKSILWGEVSYTNTEKYDVLWNETSDYWVVYPYVTADSVGGDMEGERYSFMGGYSGHYGSWFWGASLGYNAQIEYRDVDPRPKNITSNLKLNVGVGYKPFEDARHIFDLAIDVEKYKQNNDITFKSEKGRDKLFCLSGLTQHYTRFDGNCDRAFYDGHKVGLSFGTHSVAYEGFTAFLSLSRFKLEKILDLTNDLPINSIEENSGLLDAKYRTADKLVIHLLTDYSKRYGTDILYGQVTDGASYTELARIEQYTLKKGCYDVDVDKTWGEIEVGFGLVYSTHQEQYVSPQQNMKVASFSQKFSIATEKKVSRWGFSIAFDGVHASSVDSCLEGVGNDLDDYMVALVRDNYNCLSSDLLNVGAKGMVTADILNDKSVYLSIDFHHSHYTINRNINHFEFRLGFEY